MKSSTGMIARHLVGPDRERSRFKGLESALVFALLVLMFGSRTGELPFHRDESFWIGTSYYFDAFVAGDFSRETWRPQYWTLTQPPMARYIIGAGRRLAGFGAKDLNPSWNYGLDEEANLRHGHKPSPALLSAARRTEAVVAALCGLLLFLLARRIACRGAAYLTVILYGANPYLVLMLCRAMSEAPLLLFVLLTVWLSGIALCLWRNRANRTEWRMKSGWKIWMIFPATGASCGIAGACKLNGLLAAGSVAALAVAAIWRYQGGVKTWARLRLAVLTGLIVGVLAESVFVLLNPFLYAAPLRRTADLFLFRMNEIENQLVAIPEGRIHGLGERIWIVSHRVFQEYSTLTTSWGFYINLLLCCIGAAYVGKKAFGWFTAGEEPSSAFGLAVIVVPAPLLLAAAMTPLNWDRYYLLPVVFSLIFIACGATFVVSLAARLFARHREPGPERQVR